MPIGFEGADLPPVNEPGFKPSVRPGGGGPPGGGPGGPPGGGFGGFGGVRPQVFRGLQGMGEDIPIVMRRMGIGANDAVPGAPGRTGAPALMAPGQPVSQAPAAPMGYATGGFVPGVTGGPPQPSDTVPAALTPGEMVMNRGVMSNPTIAAVLTLLNILGADKQTGAMGAPCPECGEDMNDTSDQMPGHNDATAEAGGMEDEGNCTTCGKKPKGFGCGGRVGYAFGGFASTPGQQAQPGNDQQGGFGFPAAGGTSNFNRSPVRALLAGNGSFAQPAAPAMPGGTPFNNGYTYNNVGGVTGGYDAANPWGHFTENRGTDVYGSWVRQMGNAGAAGVYNPRGNQALIRGMREGAQSDADALVRRNMTQADLGGLDPAQRAVAKLEALRSTGRGVQDIMAQTRANALGSADQFYKNLVGQLGGAATGFIGADNAAEQQRMTDRANRPSGLSQFGQIAGSLGGAYLGGRMPGVPQTSIYNPGGHGGLDYLSPAP